MTSQVCDKSPSIFESTADIQDDRMLRSFARSWSRIALGSCLG